MRHWYHVETQQHKPFSVILEWTYEDSALSDCFDETVSDLEDMINRCDSGVDTHYIARVRVMYDGVEMGSDTLGSCYARDCDPSDDMKAGIDGYLEDMINNAMEEARSRAAAMLEQLKRDFLEVDSQLA
jgi:hypothetical protein